MSFLGTAAVRVRTDRIRPKNYFVASVFGNFQSFTHKTRGFWVTFSTYVAEYYTLTFNTCIVNFTTSTSDKGRNTERSALLNKILTFHFDFEKMG